MYVLLLVAALPRLKEPGVLRYNTLACLVLLLESIPLRFICRATAQRVSSWFVFEVSAFLFSLLAGSIATYVTELGTFGMANFKWTNWALSGVQCSVVLFLWCNLYFSIKQRMKLAEEYERMLRGEAEVREARLTALRYQLNPHFLFNALNAVSTLVLQERISDATRVIGQISDFLRTALSSQVSPEVTLSQEVATMEKYLAVEQTRFGQRLRVRVEVSAETTDAMVPSMILQPIVENAVKHGVSRAVGNGLISVRSTKEEDRLQIFIANSGQVVDEPAEPNKVAGIGLSNTRQRLSTFYGSDFRFVLEWPKEGGCRVSLNLPYRSCDRTKVFL